MKMCTRCQHEPIIARGLCAMCIEADRKKPKIDLAELDQGFTLVVKELVPHYAAIFRALCKEEGIGRAEALALAVAYIQKPIS